MYFLDSALAAYLTRQRIGISIQLEPIYIPGSEPGKGKMRHFAARAFRPWVPGSWEGDALGAAGIIGPWSGESALPQVESGYTFPLSTVRGYARRRFFLPRTATHSGAHQQWRDNPSPILALIELDLRDGFDALPCRSLLEVGGQGRRRACRRNRRS